MRDSLLGSLSWYVLKLAALSLALALSLQKKLYILTIEVV